jgi:hypothetical protein
VVQRRGEIPVGVPGAPARLARAPADAAPVEAQRGDPGLLTGVGDLVHDRRLHAAAVQRVWRSDHGAICGRGAGRGEEDSVERQRRPFAGDRDRALALHPVHRCSSF